MSISSSLALAKDKIGVVTITYNSSRQVTTLIKSLASSSNIIDNIVIIENNSPESAKTKQTIIKLASYYPELKIKFLENKVNQGFSKACNQGARIVKSRFLLFVNPDTKTNANSLNTLLRHAIKGKYDILGGRCIKLDGNLHRTAVRHPNLIIGLFEFSNLGKLLGINSGERKFYYVDKNIESSKADLEVDAVGGAYLLAKKSSFDRLGGFDDNFFMYLEDVDLGYRAKKLGMKVAYCPHSTIIHEGGSSSNNIHHIFQEAWFRSRKLYFNKHYSKGINVIIQSVFALEEAILRVRSKLLT